MHLAVARHLQRDVRLRPRWKRSRYCPAPAGRSFPAAHPRRLIPRFCAMLAGCTATIFMQAPPASTSGANEHAILHPMIWPSHGSSFSPYSSGKGHADEIVGEPGAGPVLNRPFRKHWLTVFPIIPSRMRVRFFCSRIAEHSLRRKRMLRLHRIAGVGRRRIRPFGVGEHMQVRHRKIIQEPVGLVEFRLRSRRESR